MHTDSLDIWHFNVVRRELATRISILCLGSTWKWNQNEYYVHLKLLIKKKCKRAVWTSRKIWAVYAVRRLSWNVCVRSVFKVFDWESFHFNLHLVPADQMRLTARKKNCRESKSTRITRARWSKMFSKYPNRVLKTICIILITSGGSAFGSHINWMRLTSPSEFPCAICCKNVNKTDLFLRNTKKMVIISFI